MDISKLIALDNTNKNIKNLSFFYIWLYIKKMCQKRLNLFKLQRLV